MKGWRNGYPADGFYFYFTGGHLVRLAKGSKGTVHRARLVPNGELERLVLIAVPFRLVADDGRVEDASLDPQVGHVGRRQAPLGQKLDGLNETF